MCFHMLVTAIAACNMRFFNPLAAFATLASLIMAQGTPAPPTMTLVYSMEAKLGARFSLGAVPGGQERIVIPIVGGTFKGPRLSGKPGQIFSYDTLAPRHCGVCLTAVFLPPLLLPQ